MLGRPREVIVGLGSGPRIFFRGRTVFNIIGRRTAAGSPRNSLIWSLAQTALCIPGWAPSPVLPARAQGSFGLMLFFQLINYANKMRTEQRANKGGKILKYRRPWLDLVACVEYLDLFAERIGGDGSGACRGPGARELK